MAPRNDDDLANLLIRLRLVTPDKLAQAQRLQSQTPKVALADILMRQQLVTPFQMTRIKKNDTDSLVLGGHKLLYRNASGSFARVYRAESIQTGQTVALKLLRQRWASDLQAVNNFRREAEMCMRLKHRNIVPIYNVGHEGKHHFFTMEFVEGGNLRDFIKIRKQLEPIEACRCAQDICAGLEYALSKGLTHRDMKMSNVLMSSTGVAKLVDFGLAGDMADDGKFDDDGAGRAIEYATIERGTNAPYSDPRTDLFFVGAVLYELLSGQPPWPGTKSREERRHLSRYSHVTPIAELIPEISPHVASIVSRLLQIDPDRRYQTPQDAVDALDGALREIGGLTSEQAILKDESVGKTKKTIMCVESRKKMQDVLRDYFSGKGYRVLIVGDFERAIQRVKQGSKRPDCVMFMGAESGEQVTARYRELRAACESVDVASVTILSEKQGPQCKGQIKQTSLCRIMVQPVNLTRVRLTIEKAINQDD